MGGLIRFGWKLGNERIEALCARLGDPQRRYRVVHVAGTKGKGFSHGAGRRDPARARHHYRRLLFTLRLRCARAHPGRWRADPRGSLAGLVTQLPAHRSAGGDEHGQTTEFELKTATAFHYFAERAVAAACIEVGIGGRLDDATSFSRS